MLSQFLSILFPDRHPSAEAVAEAVLAEGEKLEPDDG